MNIKLTKHPTLVSFLKREYYREDDWHDTMTFHQFLTIRYNAKLYYAPVKQRHSSITFYDEAIMTMLLLKCG